MAIRTLHGRCPQCCPDGGACFELTYTDDGKPAKRCNNCFLETPLRQVRKPAGPNATQQRVIEQLRAAGWQVTVKMIGRKAWLDLDHPGRNWILGNQGCGTVGPAGALKLRLFRLGGDKNAITDDIGLDVYFLRG